MSDVHPRLRDNVERLRARIVAACERSGRDPHTVCLVAVTKSADLRWVAPLVQLGVRVLGESRPQQLAQRATAVPIGVEWHLVGHLQRNKVRLVLPHAALIHSVNSLRLLERIDVLAGELGLTPRVLLEVNVSGEASKHGFTPQELRAGLSSALALPQVRIEGLMTMAPLDDHPEESRPVFRGLRELRDELQAQAPQLKELSMGMSNDFEIAIEEGATCVRVGSLLFEGIT